VLPLQKGLNDPFSLEAPVQARSAETRSNPFDSLIQSPILPVGAGQHRHHFHSADSPELSVQANMLRVAST
jgi:hypothetical protein